MSEFGILETDPRNRLKGDFGFYFLGLVVILFHQSYMYVCNNNNIVLTHMLINEIWKEYGKKYGHIHTQNISGALNESFFRWPL